VGVAQQLVSWFPLVSFDGIYNEHIIYGSSCLNVHFCLLFNALLRHGVVASDFCSGVIISK